METRVSSPRRSSVAGAASMLGALLAVMASAVAHESEMPSLVVAPAGGVATLRAFPSVPGFRYSWYRDGQKISGESGHRRLLPNGGLQFVGLRRGDAGVYRGRATDERVWVRRDVTLNVTDPVEIAANIAGELNANVTGELGRPLSIECLAYGHPEPMVMWKHRHNDRMFFVNDKQYTFSEKELLIKALDVASLGEYSCNVYNGISKPVSWSVMVRAFRLDNSSASPYLLERGPTNVAEIPDMQVSSPQPTTDISEIPISTESSNEVIPAKDCRQQTEECNAIQCPYAVQRTKDADGCTKCSCLKHPCEDKECPAGQRCTVYTDRDPITDDVRYTADCRIVNKPGVCPAAETNEREGDCRRECNDDADCLGVEKCCRDGCSQRCLVPESSGALSATPTPRYPDAGVQVRSLCVDNPFMANCTLIVRANYCGHRFYGHFCCKSCTAAGLLPSDSDE